VYREGNCQWKGSLGYAMHLVNPWQLHRVTRLMSPCRCTSKCRVSSAVSVHQNGAVTLEHLTQMTSVCIICTCFSSLLARLSMSAVSVWSTEITSVNNITYGVNCCNLTQGLSGTCVLCIHYITSKSVSTLNVSMKYHLISRISLDH